MDLRTFRRIVTAFADNSVDVDISKGTLVAQIRDEFVEASVLDREGTIWVKEGGDTEPAYSWIIRRLARLHLLADRILAQIPEEKFFVDPEGSLLDDLESVPNSAESPIFDAAAGIESALEERVAGVTRVLYLTSDAGEGKTTLINFVARTLARKFKEKKSSWLLVPVSLGGRPFMALDDVVVAELTNRFRFSLYYDAFAELVRLNAVVPALDGFEEVFLETGSREAVSALGNLINHLNGSGRVLIAARKAYFEVRSFASQARIFDTIGQDAGASFERLSLRRWSKEKFVEYAKARGLKEPSKIHEQIAQQLHDQHHPLITRAVLVARLIEVALEGDVNTLVKSLAKDPEDYFYQFVGALIEREANTKWIDRSRAGDGASSLLSVDEHLALLTQIAREMWINKSDSLGVDYVELVADMFSADRKKPAAIAHQVKERLHQHSLLAVRGPAGRKIAFDHEDFRLFFLGQALGTDLVVADPKLLGAFLQAAPVPPRTIDAAISFVVRGQADVARTLAVVTSLGKAALDTSYEKENSGLITIRLLEVSSQGTPLIQSLSFPPDALAGRSIRGVEFQRCRFQATEIGPNADFKAVFRECHFDRVDIRIDTKMPHVRFIDCSVASVFLVDKEESYYAPDEIQAVLRLVTEETPTSADSATVSDFVSDVDRETRIAEQALRSFMRATHLNENVFRTRLGQSAHEFFESVLPSLLEEGVLEETEYKGSGVQRRFKLVAPMRNIEPAIRNAGNLASFIKILKDGG